MEETDRVSPSTQRLGTHHLEVSSRVEWIEVETRILRLDSHHYSIRLGVSTTVGRGFDNPTYYLRLRSHVCDYTEDFFFNLFVGKDSYRPTECRDLYIDTLLNRLKISGIRRGLVLGQWRRYYWVGYLTKFKFPTSLLKLTDVTNLEQKTPPRQFEDLPDLFSWQLGTPVDPSHRTLCVSPSRSGTDFFRSRSWNLSSSLAPSPSPTVSSASSRFSKESSQRYLVLTDGYILGKTNPFRSSVLPLWPLLNIHNSWVYIVHEK